jgi:CRP-like cAMP-binding protein
VNVTANGNRLLAMLPPCEYGRVRPHLEPVSLAKGTILSAAGALMEYRYFVLSGMVSLLVTTEQDETVEVAAVGSEGVVGLPVVFDGNTACHDAIVSISGRAWRLRSEAFRSEFRRGAALQDVLLRYTLSLLAQLSQSAVCHRFHTSSQRLSRWLLQACDRVDSDSLDMTQELLAHLLGIQRTYVNAAAIELQDADLIRYRHGKITIVNRNRLERAACDCYRFVRDRAVQLAAVTAWLFTAVQDAFF